MIKFDHFSKHQFCCCPFIDDLGWKGPYRSPCFNPPAMGRDPFHQPRVLAAPSNLALNPAREGAATLLWATWASVSPPSQGRISSLYLI